MSAASRPADTTRQRGGQRRSSERSSRPPPKGAVGLALGGGAARGIAHIPILEALDDLGIRPRLIAGTSIGAIMGGIYASGLSGREIRQYARELLESRTELIRRVIARIPGSITSLFNPMTPAMFEPQTLFEALLPDALPPTFKGLKIPLKVVASDFYAQSEVVLEAGPLLPAIAASAALPALLKPVEIGERILIDGGFVNPTSFDLLDQDAHITIAIDVTGKPGGTKPRARRRRQDGRPPMPNSLDAWIGAAQITLHSIVEAKLRSQAPDILIRPDVGRFGALDFFKVEEILSAGAPAAEELKRALDEKLAALT